MKMLDVFRVIQILAEEDWKSEIKDEGLGSAHARILRELGDISAKDAVELIRRMDFNFPASFFAEWAYFRWIPTLKALVENPAVPWTALWFIRGSTESHLRSTDENREEVEELASEVSKILERCEEGGWLQRHIMQMEKHFGHVFSQLEPLIKKHRTPSRDREILSILEEDKDEWHGCVVPMQACFTAIRERRQLKNLVFAEIKGFTEAFPRQEKEG